MDLDKNSPVPLYYQLAETLRKQIRSGALKPGDQIPTERELCEQTGISRVTVRHAIAYLMREGLLVARSGKGTFVAESKLTYEALHLMGFTEKMMSQGKPFGSRVIEQAVVLPPKSVAASLQLERSDKAVKIVRVRLSQNVPLLLETVFIPRAACPGLERENLSGKSLYEILEQKYKQKLLYAHQSLEATVANDYEAKILGIEAGSPMILLEGLTFTAQDRPIENFKAVYRGDRFKFEFASPRNGYAIELPHPQLVNLSYSPQA